MSDLRQELIERYEATGKVGFVKPENLQEALSLIDTVVSIYEQPEKQEIKEEVEVISLHELSQRFKDFFKSIE